MVLNEAKLQRQLARLSEETDRTVKSGLARLAFEVQDAIGDGIEDALEFSGPNTQRFVARSYKVRYSTAAGIFTAVLYPLAKAGKLLLRHVDRTPVTAKDKADLRAVGAMVIPVDDSIRGRSGRVLKRFLPETLTRRDAKGRREGFLTRDGKTIMRFTPNGGVEPVFTIKRQTENPPRIDVQMYARNAVRRRAGIAFADAIRRAMTRARGG